MSIKLTDGREVTIEYLIDHPDEFGFRWSTEQLEKPAGTVITKNAQIPVLTNLTKAMLWLDESNILGMADSSSYRVKVQNPMRLAIYEDRPLGGPNKTRELQVFAIETMLGVRSRKARVTVVEKRTYGAADGSQHDTQEAATAASLAFIVTTLIDLGLTAEEANKAARQKLNLTPSA